MSKKNKKFSCYAVVGSNGYALTNNWLDCQTYMKNLNRERYKGFYSYEDAYDWIVDEFDGDSRYKFGFKFCSLEDLIKKELYVEKTSATNHNY